MQVIYGIYSKPTNQICSLTHLEKFFQYTEYMAPYTKCQTIYIVTLDIPDSILDTLKSDPLTGH